MSHNHDKFKMSYLGIQDNEYMVTVRAIFDDPESESQVALVKVDFSLKIDTIVLGEVEKRAIAKAKRLLRTALTSKL